MRKSKSINITHTQAHLNSVNAALDIVEARITALLPAWNDLTPDNKRKVLDNTPLIARVVELAQRLQ